MFQRTKICTSLLVAFGGLAAVGAQAQDATQRVEITGSSIKRINAESSLPVQSYTADDIKKTGVTTVTDLIQALPAMQGFTTNSQSINGGGGGAATASLHALGSNYTLVLLNGRRMAPLNTGSVVNLNSIPLSAIERVDVLTDGASALYGADAIAGVVNFITRKDSQEGFASASAYMPQHKGGASATASISKGFGDLNKDKFNFLLSASIDKQQKLDASQRPFSKTGVLKFMDGGEEQEIDLVSSNSVPGNVTATLSDGSKVQFSPYLMKNGACSSPTLTMQIGNRCFFDYSATVESVAESHRASLFGAGRVQLGESASVFSELGFSRFYNDPRYAPPAQQLIRATQGLIDADITPYLSALGKGGTTVSSATYNLRLYDAGGRQDRYQTDALHFVLGGDFSLGAIDLTTSYTHSQNKWSDTAEGGYADKIQFDALVASGTWDPLMSVYGEGKTALASAVLHQKLDESTSSIDNLQVRGSTTLGRLAGGDIGLGLGLDVTKQKYSDTPSAILMGNNKLQKDYFDAIVGGGGGALPFNSSRKSYGVYTELNLPLTKQLEVNGAARYDSYGAVQNDMNFDTDGNPIGSATQGNKNSSATYKLSTRFAPTKDFLVRASLGTGFRAPTLANVTSPLQAAGSTGNHDCPFQPGDAQYAWCGGSSSSEWNAQSGGNPLTGAGALKPEHSTQWTVGFVVEPMDGLTASVDLWAVRLKDQIGSITESTAFGDGKSTTRYPGLFTYAKDPNTGEYQLTFLSVPINTGRAAYQGLDLSSEYRTNTPLGRLTSRAKATYMLRADYQQPGLDGYFNSMNKIGLDGQNTFQWTLNASVTLQSGAFTHTLTGNFKPGYQDDYTDYCSGGYNDATGECMGNRHVGNYNVFDWQTKYDVNKDLAITVGLKNMFDTKPPFSIIDQGGTSNARGFDGRYTDPIGRQFYLTASYKF